ncbi:MAG: protoheme IX farnesyltransferase [Robiginitomaculum sp.]|nr:MAG: protoheme IX farnesyltransferase [Robiginitomaculum sp.]
MKPRVMSLVVFTAFVGLVAAPADMNPILALVSVFAIALGAGASGALNMWFDADIDAKMRRTKLRPIPSGRVRGRSALAFGLIMAVISVVSLGAAANYMAAMFLAFTIFFYAVIYTMVLKRHTPHNIVIGGAAGAFPPMIGWIAATGSVDMNAVIMFGIIFLWTPPHFWALALYKAGDYEKAGVPMLPVVAGAKVTRRQIMFYTLALSAMALAPAVTGLGGLLYAVVAGVLSLAFVALSVRVLRSRAGDGDEEAAAGGADLYEVRKGDKAARDLFGFSILYLFALFSALLAEHGLGLYKGIIIGSGL